MPEGPEIRAVADKLSSALMGRPLDEVYFAFETLKPYEEALRGQRLRAIEARGKALLIRFENGLSIYTHSLLYGKWFIRPAHSLPKTGRQLRLALHNTEKSALLYSASSIEVLHDEDLATHRYLSALGPDVLHSTTRTAAVLKRFGDRRFRSRSVARLLLDQSFVCGPGNYLRSEILYVAKVWPYLRPADAEEATLKRVAAATLTISRRAYETAGTTVDPRLVRRLVQQGLSRKQYRHYVYGREGQPCRLCGTEIVRDTLDGRGLYHCPHCQPDPQRLAPQSDGV